MDTSCLRLKFTPLLKNDYKNGSKCCLEIIPEVSCVQNLDKIQWQHGDDSIEYMIPITYKVILKKKHKKPAPKVDDGQIKTYHSCVDLVPSSLNVTVGRVANVFSDTFITMKHTENVDDTFTQDTKKVTENRKTKEGKVSEVKHKRSDIELVSDKNKYNKKESKDDSTQFVEKFQTSNIILYKKIYLVDKRTSTPFAGDLGCLTSTEMTSYNGTLEWDSSTAVKMERKLSITPICSINTEDNITNPRKGMLSNLIILRVQEPKYFNINHNTTISRYKAPNEKCGFKVIKEINNQSYESLTNDSSERILPQTRVAQFMQSVERELMPLKNTLNDMIEKCSFLGFIRKEKESIFSPRNDTCSKKDIKSNRVVYSMVFDEEMGKNDVAERIIDSLSFEVEAVPQTLEVSGTSKSTPVNIKVKVRKKDEAPFKQGVVSVPKLGQPKKTPDIVRLVSSDQTVLSFQVFVDTEPAKKPEKKRKKFFGGCLSSQDNDDEIYTETAAALKPEETVKRNFGLSKNVQDLQLQTRKPAMFFGNACKPGGCLDPAFDEEKYSYEPIDTSKHNTGLPNVGAANKIISTAPLDKTASNADKSPKSGTKSSQPSGVSSKTSFREFDESYFSLNKVIAEKKLESQTDNITEVPTTEIEKILTKLYPQENDISSFKSNTNSSIQDLKGNEEILVTTVVAVGGGVVGEAMLKAGAATEKRNSKQDAANTENEKGLDTSLSTNENEDIIQSTDNLIRTEKKDDLSSAKTKLDEGLSIPPDDIVNETQYQECDKDTNTVRQISNDDGLTQDVKQYQSDNDTQDDRITKGDLTKEDLTKDSLTIDDLTKDDLPRDNLTKDDLIEDDLTEDDPTKDNLTKDDLTKEDLTKDGLTIDVLTKDDLTRDNVTKDDLTEDDLTEDDHTKDNLTKDDLTKEDLTKDGLTIDVPTKDDLTRDNVTKDDLTEDDLTEDDPTKDNLTKDDLTKEDLTKDGLTIDDLTKDDLTRDNITKDDLTEDDLTEDDPTKDNLTKDDLTKEDLTKDGLTIDVLTKDDLTRDNVTKDDLTEDDLTEDDHTKDNLTKDDLTKEDLTKDGLTIDVPTKDDLTRDNVTKDDLTEDDLTEDDPTKDNLTKDDLTKEDLTKDGLTIDVLTKDDLTRDNITKDDFTEDDLTEDDPTKDNLTKDNLTKDILKEDGLINDDLTKDNISKWDHKKDDFANDNLTNNGLTNDDLTNDDLTQDENRTNDMTVTEAEDQPIDGVTKHLDNENFKNEDLIEDMNEELNKKNYIDMENDVNEEDINDLLKGQDSKSPEVKKHDDTERLKDDDLHQSQDSNDLNNIDTEKSLKSSAYDNKNLKTDFSDSGPQDIKNNYSKIKYPTSDSILSAGDNDISKLTDQKESILNQVGAKFVVKKDFINMNLAFQSYTNDQNEIVIKSLDSVRDIKRQPRDNVTIIKSQLQMDTPYRIKVPIDTRNYMTLEVNGPVRQGSPDTVSRASEEAYSNKIKTKENISKAASQHSNTTDETDLETFQNLLSAVYEKQLIPLQRLIAELKEDVDTLASEQLWLKENCRKLKKPTLKLIHSNRKCGCTKR